MSGIIAAAFLIGGFVGCLLGMLTLALAGMAKRNASDMPEIPIVTVES